MLRNLYLIASGCFRTLRLLIQYTIQFPTQLVRCPISSFSIKIPVKTWQWIPLGLPLAPLNNNRNLIQCFFIALLVATNNSNSTGGKISRQSHSTFIRGFYFCYFAQKTNSKVASRAEKDGRKEDFGKKSIQMSIKAAQEINREFYSRVNGELGWGGRWAWSSRSLVTVDPMRI